MVPGGKRKLRARPQLPGLLPFVGLGNGCWHSMPSRGRQHASPASRPQADALSLGLGKRAASDRKGWLPEAPAKGCRKCHLGASIGSTCSSLSKARLS